MKALSPMVLIPLLVLPIGCSRGGYGSAGDAAQERTELLEKGIQINDATLQEWRAYPPSSLAEIAGKAGTKTRNKVIGIEIRNGKLVKNLDGLGMFPHLWNLRIEGSAMRDLRVTESPRLEVLTLLNGDLETLDGVEAFKDLVGLSINGNPLKSVHGVEALRQLRYLNISNTPIASLSGVELPISLKQIFARDSSLKSIAGFQSALRTIEELDVTHNDIASIDDVSDWGKLKHLRLFLNPVMERYRNGDGSLPKEVEYKGIILNFEGD